MIRCVLVFALAGLAGCSADRLSKEADAPGCADNAATVSFGVEPARIARGEDVSLRLRWETFVGLLDPVATLRVGEGPVVEVEVPLVLDADNLAGYGYRALVRNPFGAGAPVGTVEVLATSVPAQGCSAIATAATAFELE